MERLFRRPRSKAKERLVEVLLELLATCKYVSVSLSFQFISFWEAVNISSLCHCRQFSVLTERRSHSRPNKLDRCRRDFIKKNLVNVSSGFSGFNSIPLSLCQTVSSPSHLPSNLPDSASETGGKSKKKSHQADSQATFDGKQEIPEDAPPFG